MHHGFEMFVPKAVRPAEVEEVGYSSVALRGEEVNGKMGRRSDNCGPVYSNFFNLKDTFTEEDILKVCGLIMVSVVGISKYIH